MYPIAVTRFTSDSTLDLPSTDRPVDFYRGCGVTGLTVLGIIGEAAKRTAEESRVFVQRVMARVDGRVPVVVGAFFSRPGTDGRAPAAREDLATLESWASPISTRAAIEAMPPGCIAVADAMGVTDAGIFGDILCARMAYRGVAGLVTDGAVRDLAGVLGTGLPVW